MKVKELKRKLTIESMIALAILSVLGGGTYYLSMVSDDYEQANATLQSQSSTVTGQMTKLRDQYNKVKQNMDLYNEVMSKNANDELLINRQGVRNKFDQFKSEHFLSNVKLSMSAVEDTPGANKYKTLPNVIVQSEVTVSFDALNDEHVYDLLQSIMKDFSGVTRVIKFSISRENKVNDASLSAIAKSGQFPMVKGDIKFLWFGMKPLEPSISGPATK